MKFALLDTNFILTCVKQKIDFFEELELNGLTILIPKQVIRELNGIKNSKTELALKILKKNKFKEIDIGKGDVDKRIKKFADENFGIFIATLDKKLKNKIC